MKVKICGITNPRDAELAIEFGADALGFVHEPTSPRFIGGTEASESLPKWIALLPPLTIKVAVFGRVDRPAIKGVFDLVQGVEWGIFPEPAPKRIHALRLLPSQRADDLVHRTVDAAAILLDAHRDGSWGGTGEAVDWDLAAEIVQRSQRPIILAGGLTPENVGAAVRRVRPYAVDVSSGVEASPGQKDPDRLHAFIEAAKSA